MNIPIEDYPAWLRITENPLWPYEIKSSGQGSGRINYKPGLVAQIGGLRKEGMSYEKIAELVGESRERVRHICEYRLGE